MSAARTPTETARLIVRELLAVGPDETVALVTDPSTPAAMQQALVADLADLGAEWAVLQQPDRAPEEKNRLNPAIGRALEATDVMIALTRTSGAPIYSREIKDLIAARRIRFMSMVMRSMENFTTGGATADYRALHAEGLRLAQLWSNARTMRITSNAGTDISAPIAYDDVLVECGYATEPGTSAAFSDGEVSSRPLEGTAEGTFVIDGPGAVIGLPEAPVRVEVAKGRVTAIHGTSAAAERLREITATIENADNIAEFGVGLNPACRANGDFEEEKKRRGNVHIAIGDNIVFGGTTESAVHMDLVCRDVSVWLDDRQIVDRGKVCLD